MQEFKHSTLPKKRCPNCDHLIPSDSIQCPFCSNYLNGQEKKKRPFVCPSCGAIHAHKPHYCPDCGRPIKPEPINLEKSWGWKPWKIIGASLTVILILALITGVHAYANSDAFTNTIHNSPQDQYRFDLHGNGVIDHQGRLAVLLHFNTNTPANIYILDRSRRPLAQQTVTSDQNNIIIDIGNYWHNYENMYYTVYVTAHNYEILQETHHHNGPTITIENMEVKWNYNNHNHREDLEFIKISCRNSGDLPFYPDYISLNLNLEDTYILSFLGSADSQVIQPGQQNTLVVDTTSITTYHRANHYHELSLHDTEDTIYDEVIFHKYLSDK